MADVAKRLCGPALLTNAGVTYYTVPALTTTILRNIHVASAVGTSYTLTLGINGITTAQFLYYQFPLPPNGTLDWSGFLVLNAGDTLQALANLTSGLNLTVSGVETT